MNNIEIIKLFENNVELETISKKYNISIKTILDYVIKYNIISNAKSRVISEDSKTKLKEVIKYTNDISFISDILNITIISLKSYMMENLKQMPESIKSNLINDRYSITRAYRKGATVKNISKRVSIKSDIVISILKEFGYEIRSIDNDDRNCTKRVYNLKHKYFNTLTERKAYYLGILFSISSVYNDTKLSKFICASVPNRNIDVLDDLSNELYGNVHPKYIKNSSVSSFIKIISQDIYNDISKYGFFDEINIPNEFRHSFIEGYLRNSFRVQKNIVRILVRKLSYRSYIENYLKNELGIVADFGDNLSIEIRRKAEVLKLMKAHPVTVSIINKNKNKQYWDTQIKLLKNHKVIYKM